MNVRDMTMPKSEYKGRETQASNTLCPCRPCYNAHDCGRFNSYTGQHEVRMECAFRYNNGCPRPMPEPVHVYTSARGRVCKRCGQRR